jgi:hypothetical protein
MTIFLKSPETTCKNWQPSRGPSRRTEHAIPEIKGLKKHKDERVCLLLPACQGFPTHRSIFQAKVLKCHIFSGSGDGSARHIHQQGYVEADDDQPGDPEYGRTLGAVGILPHDLSRRGQENQRDDGEGELQGKIIEIISFRNF